MKTILKKIKQEPMLFVSLAAAIISLFITPPSVGLIKSIDWKTLATLFMLLSVLDGFKHEDLFLPVIRFSRKMRTLPMLGFFLVYGVFFSSMFVTNDVSLIIFVPLTILLFRQRGREEFILPLLIMENTAAVRGSLLTPFGSPQNLFLFSNSGMSTPAFLKMMLPLWVGSFILIALFVLFIFRKDLKTEGIVSAGVEGKWEKERRSKRILYLALFAIVLASIVTRTSYWPYVTLFVALMLLLFDRDVYKRVDYVLLLTFFCFFIFSSSLAGNEKIAAFLKESVAGREYWWSIGISQIISNVPGAIVLWPFTTDLKALIYGLDTAGLVFIIGSLASVINLRLYSREYPGNAGGFIKAFVKYSLPFFLIAASLQLLLL